MSADRLLQILAGGESPSADDAEAAAHSIIRGEVSPVLLGAVLVGLRCRGETGPALTGFVKALRAAAHPFEGPRASVLADTCGTGGDGGGTFNISTAAAILLAACGVPVAKHGNRSASGRVGSADVMEALGVRVDGPPEVAGGMLARTGFCFLYAPAWHPAMKHAAPVRRELRIRTIFNLCGPLANPARPTHQLVGVSSRDHVLPVAEALAALGTRRALVVHGHHGHDEIMLDGETSGLLVREDGTLSPWGAKPEDFGVAAVPPEALAAEDAASSAHVIRQVLSGRKGPAANVVNANVAAVLWLAGRASTIRAAFDHARDVQVHGEGERKLEQVIEYSRAHANA